MDELELLVSEAFDEGVISEVIRPAAVLPESNARAVLVEMAAHEHAEPRTGPAAALFIDLQEHPVEAHGVVLGHDALFLVTEDLLEVVGAHAVATGSDNLIGGTTPAKLARVLAQMSPVEMQMAMAKMRARRTPSNQAHVTNQLDDPLLIAADAASAVAYGFREVETTVPVLGDAPSNAVALLIGSQVGTPGAMAQCSIEEALELRLGLRGLTSYAETISIYGTEQVLTAKGLYFFRSTETIRPYVGFGLAFIDSEQRSVSPTFTLGPGFQVLPGPLETFHSHTQGSGAGFAVGMDARVYARISVLADLTFDMTNNLPEGIGSTRLTLGAGWRF